MSRASLMLAASLTACAGAAGGPPPAPVPRLVVPGAELWHEVEIRGPGREDLLVGILAFTGADSFRLEAQTPFGVPVFEVGFDGRRFVHALAPFLEGRVPGEVLARDIHRIYFGGCPDTGTVRRTCPAGEDATLTELVTGTPPRTVRRTYRDASGRQTTIRYRRWTRYGSVVHPRRIDLESGGFSVAVALSDLRFSSTHGVPAGSVAPRIVTSIR